MAILPIHLELGAQRKADVVLRAAEADDLRLAARLLRPELVAGKSHYGKILLAQLAMQLLESAVLGRQPALTGHVHGQDHLAAQRPQQILGSVDAAHLDVVEPSHGLSTIAQKSSVEESCKGVKRRRRCRS